MFREATEVTEGALGGCGLRLKAVEESERDG